MLALKDLRRRPGRFLATAFGAATLIGTLLMQGAIYRGIVDNTLSLIRVIGADIWVLQTDVRNGVGEVSSVWSEARRAVERIRGVAAVGEVIFHYASVDEGERRQRVRLVGYELGRPGGPSEIIAGRGITAPLREVVLDRRAGIPVGAEVTILGAPYTVVGHGAHALGPSGEPVAFVTIEDARRLQNRLSDPIIRRLVATGQPLGDFRKATLLAVVLEPDAAAWPVTAAIERWGGLSATTRQEQEEVYALATIEEISATMALFALVLVVVTVAILSLTIHGMTMEKMRSIATLKLIGIPGHVIVGLVMQQSMMIGLIGYVVGASGALALRGYFPVHLVFLWQDAAIVALITLVISLVASISSVRFALGIQPAQALSG
ncbi:ABC transporter permease [Falsiroseomonas selenitidurans]|uniref:ABC3 transporter permease C-terminal domain-containing protein n=1 Tax=Falsiroseomonas selenitidurans TaxID=2716335 RepID=A0ABX1E1X2_9PROT|nr:ABC transporter permease [Falsiroseomonas selenitidurans]NKC31068.1 hypothetical protein [Falsiroseomonas selenitidurans]